MIRNPLQIITGRLMFSDVGEEQVLFTKEISLRILSLKSVYWINKPRITFTKIKNKTIRKIFCKSNLNNFI